MTATRELIRQLQYGIRRLETARPAGDVAETVRCGCDALDRLLPEGGLRRGTLAEWLAAGSGSGAATLALLYARRACQEGGAVVVVDRPRQVYPPALAGWGVPLEQVVLLYPATAQDEFWAWDQALRCPGVAAVWGWVEQLDARRFRRWQLSAESGGTLGLLLRPAKAGAQPTWAEVRLAVEPQPAAGGRRLQVRVVHLRGGASGGTVRLALDEWTGQLHAVTDAPAARWTRNRQSPAQPLVLSG